MRENRKSGLMRGSNGIGNSRPLLSTLPVRFQQIKESSPRPDLPQARGGHQSLHHSGVSLASAC